MIKKFLNELPVRQRQLVETGIIIVITIALVMLVSYSMDRSSKKNASTSRANAKKMTLMSDKVEKDLWVAAEGQNVKALGKSNEELRFQMGKMKKDLEDAEALANRCQHGCI